VNFFDLGLLPNHSVPGKTKGIIAPGEVGRSPRIPCMPRRTNSDESAADRQLIFEFFAASRQIYPALLVEAEVRKLVGFMPAGLQAAIKLGSLRPAHEGSGKVRQYALIDVLKLMVNRKALMQAARAGTEAIEIKNNRAKEARRKRTAPRTAG
jgi:hypothetical protein